MFERFKNMMNLVYKPGSQKKSNEESHLISTSLKDSIAYFKDKFNQSADLTVRQIDVDGTLGAIITMEGMINKEVLANSVTNPILTFPFKTVDPVEKYQLIRDSILSTSEQVQVTTYEDAFKFIMSGFALIAIDNNNCMLAIGIQGFSFRSISEPSNEVMERGSREGFVEPLRINMTLIRRRIKNPNMKFETMTIGSVSKTDICLCYFNNVVSPKILKELKKRINNIDLETVFASGYITPYLEEKGDLSIFSSVGISERPDTVCAKISEGRIAILVDGTPNAIIVPYLFVEYFQTLDDYAVRPYFATLIRWLKYFAFFLSILFPGLYVAVGTFNPEILPEELIMKVAKSISATPLPLLLETIMILFIYEVMREAGLRLPKPLGHAVSIVGALVIGESAVSAGIVSSPTLMVVAIATIFSYIIPNLYEPVAFLRIFFVIIGGLTGILGIMILFAATLINICSKSNFGVPFTAPVAPFKFFGMRDVAIRAGWKTLAKRMDPVQNMPGAETQTERG